MAVDVAFCREIHEGNHGGDVIAHKRALSRWNPHAYPWTNFSDLAGPYFINALMEYKHVHGLGSAPVLGAIAHSSMEKAVVRAGPHKGEPLFDSVAVQAAKNFCAQFAKSPDAAVRTRIVAAAWFWYGRRMSIAYSQFRPFTVCLPPIVPPRWDCSAFATNCQLAGGAPNPNGDVPRGEGYTGTLIDHGTQVTSVDDLKPGDLIFYYFASSSSPGFRKGDPTHVAVYVGKVNGVASVISHGHYPMSLLPYNYGAINQMRHYKVA
jgi:hypothetical protein